MGATASHTPVQVGDPAPDFALPAVGRAGSVSLADYRGRAPLLLAINRGLWCSFCRRYLVQLGSAREGLRELGVEILAVVGGTSLERVELYVAHRPALVPLAVDPELSIHRAYGLAGAPATPEIESTIKAMRIRLDQVAMTPGEIPELAEALRSVQGEGASDPAGPQPIWDLAFAQGRLYPYEMNEAEKETRARFLTQATGQFLIDRQGMVRWAKVEGVTDPPAALGNFPNRAELLAAARTLPD